LRLAVALMSQEERRFELSREAANAFARHWCEDVVIERYLAVLQEAAARQGKDRVRRKLEGVT
jgi:hypothetical protein